jgi:trehalose 6-phosphate phosphatase
MRQPRSSGAEAGWDEVIARLRERPASTGVFVDFDGTLSPIVDRPEDAAPVDGAVDVLASLATIFAVVAIVSGRGLEDLKMRVRTPGVLLAGSYGRERSDAGFRRSTEGWETVAIAAVASVRDLNGVHVERKGTGVALHYRANPEHAMAVDAIAETLAREFALEIRPGRMVVELITPGPGKGDAIATLIAERALDRVLVAGDDWGDLEAFRLLRESGVDATIVAVVSEEAPPGLTDHADLVLRGPAELVAFLRELGA